MSWDAIIGIFTAMSFIVILITGIVIFYQLRELKKGTVAQAFSTIASVLEDDKVRMARRTLIGNSKSDFNTWTGKEKDEAEIACKSYDVVGIMVQNKMIPQKMVIKEWRRSIIKSYEHARPMIEDYRKDRGDDFWKNFEWLYDKAKNPSFFHWLRISLFPKKVVRKP